MRMVNTNRTNSLLKQQMQPASCTLTHYTTVYSERELKHPEILYLPPSRSS
jgi:hypothetical protein